MPHLQSRSIAPANRPEAISNTLSDVLAETRAAVEHGHTSATQCLDRLEFLLMQSGSLESSLDWPAARSGGLVQWQISRIRRYVEENLARRLSTVELAAQLSLSGTHFARAFKNSLGCTPHTYILQQRIRLAKDMMLKSDVPLSEIAVADQAHLCRVFGRLVGASPSRWRRTHRVG